MYSKNQTRQILRDSAALTPRLQKLTADTDTLLKKVSVNTDDAGSMTILCVLKKRLFQSFVQDAKAVESELQACIAGQSGFLASTINNRTVKTAIAGIHQELAVADMYIDILGRIEKSLRSLQNAEAASLQTQKIVIRTQLEQAMREVQRR